MEQVIVMIVELTFRLDSTMLSKEKNLDFVRILQRKALQPLSQALKPAHINLMPFGY